MDENLEKKHKSQMSDFERIRDFQRKLYLKAKQDKTFRFYVLYDKIRILRFLKEAYKRVKANKGRNGVDGISFDDIEEYGLDKYLREIQKELEERTEGLLQVKEGTLYPILHRLKKERLLNVRDEKSESGPSRKVYVLTGEGDRVYRQLTVILGDIFEKLEALKSE